MYTLIQDCRYAIRQLLNAPGFTITAWLTLAIGIGANTAIFTLVHGVLLKSLPIANPEQLYRLGDEFSCCVEGGFQDDWSLFSYPFYLQVRDRSGVFDEVAAMQSGRPALSVRRTGSAVRAESFGGEYVSGNYFSTLGVGAFVGRVFQPSDDQPGAAPVAVMTYRAWQNQYASDPSIVGASLTINGFPVTVVGVTPPAFFGDRLESDPPSFWLPLALEPTFTRENTLLRATPTAWLYILGRLKPGAQVSQVSAQLTTELQQYLRTPGNANPNEDLNKIGQQKIRVAPGGAGINAMKDDYERGLLLLMAAAVAVLVIACANLANLLLARGTATRVRTALQLALGASRGRIIRSQVTESLILSLLGGAGGLLVARLASDAMLGVAFRGSSDVPISSAPSLTVLLFAFGVSLVTGIIFSAGPAWMASGADPVDALRGASRVMHDSSALPQRSLIILQAALSLVLLTMAGLLTESLRNLQNQPYGFEKRARLLITMNPQSAGYTQERLRAFYEQLQDRLNHMPGVVSASLSLYTAQQGNNWGEGVFFSGKSGDFDSSWNRVSARYFETIGTPIVLGRSIGQRDTAASQRVAVINEAFARKYFPNEDPIGQHFGKDEPSHAGDYEIVGVAKDAKYGDASREVRPMFFVPLTQKIAYTAVVSNRVEDASMYMGTIAVHTDGDPNLLATGVRRILTEVDPNLTPTSVRSFEEQVKIQTGDRTLIAQLAGAFGLIALLLASVGLYGVTSYRVARRTNEVGLRMALGATRQDILSLVLRGAFSQVALGLAIGIPLALLSRQWLQHQLFGIAAFDPWSLTFAVVVLGLCAFVASVLPAGRAAAIEPMRALRAE